MTGTRTRTLELGPGQSVEVTLAEAGTGRTALVLHGGGGPAGATWVVSPMVKCTVPDTT